MNQTETILFSEPMVQFYLNDTNISILSPGNVTGVLGETHILITSLTYFAYSAIFTASLFGNSIIIHIIRTDNSMKNTTNYLILNQACADIVFTFAELTNFIVRTNSLGSQSWFGGHLGLATCKMFLEILVIPPVFSNWILVAIAVERFCAVTRPLKTSPISQHLKKTILFLWVWAIASSTNVLVKGEVVKTENYYYCTFSSDWIISHLILAAVNIALPLFIVAFLYTIVCHNLWSREVPGEGPNQNQGQAEAINTARKVTRVMIAIVVLYAMCWFPFDVIFALNLVIFVQISSELHTFLIWLTICYSGINPYIYLTFSQKFRNQFRYIFRNFFRRIKIHNILRYRSQSVDLEQL